MTPWRSSPSPWDASSGGSAPRKARAGSSLSASGADGERLRQGDRLVLGHQRQDLTDLLLLHAAKDTEHRRLVQPLEDRGGIGRLHGAVYLPQRLGGGLDRGARRLGAGLETFLDLLEARHLGGHEEIEKRLQA